MSYERLIDIELIVMYLTVLAVLGVVAWSVVCGLRKRDKSQDVVNNIPVSKIVWGTVALFVVSMIVTFLLGSSSPMQINGADYAKSFWLKSSDMFINTAIVLLLAAVVCIAFAMTGFYRRRK